MIIKCPNCQTDIIISDNKVKQSESNVDCSKCNSLINLESDKPKILTKIEFDLEKMIKDALGVNKSKSFKI